MCFLTEIVADVESQPVACPEVSVADHHIVRGRRVVRQAIRTHHLSNQFLSSLGV